ncbi:Inositol-pentakisphosphate 2-kinase [Entomortierella beljakovae]|nr:Inositol-pentakisphosphate 2-kinase [Entomortierella beljakovae]
MEVVTLNELYIVQHWKYRAEGNANLVLEYKGPIPHYIAISLPRKFLEGLAEAISQARPKFRLHKVIDFSQVVGFLVLDHTQFIKSSIYPSICAEIKPKWGFLTASAFIRNDQHIKRRKCRFCMYQHKKINSGEAESLSEYCPIDLFSGKQALLEESLTALTKTPQNNLKIFIDGVQKATTDKEILQGLQKFNTTDAQPLQPPLLTDIIAKILMESPLLKRLSRLQQGLDSLDIETIHRFYSDLKDPITGALPDPTVDEYLKAAETFLERTDLNDMMDSSDDAFIRGNAESIGFGPEDVEAGDIPDALKLHYIHEFLLSCTLKDCSILITIRQGNDEDEYEDVSTSEGTVSRFDTEDTERCQRIEVEGNEYIYKITCIDLDPKKVSTIPKYLRKDREIVNHYLTTVGDREPSCTFVYFSPTAIFVTSTLLPHLILVLGASISLVSFLGYYGVMNEKRWVLWIHVLILLIAVALQITVGAIAFAYRNQGNEVLDRAWERVFKSEPRVIMDLESFFQCCGFEHVLDRPVPMTCAIDTHYMTGCRENIQTAFQDSLQAIGVIGAILGGIELVSLLGAVILFHRFEDHNYQRNGEENLVQALLESQAINHQIDEARRRRNRDIEYQVLANQLREQTRARAEEEGFYDPGDRPGGVSDQPPSYGSVYNPQRPRAGRKTGRN